jgi:hypothetical protein
METLEDLRREWTRMNRTACALLAARLPVEARPRFATTALDVCLRSLSGPTAVSEVVRVGGDPKRWSEAHVAFDAVRSLTLECEKRVRPSRDPQYCLLFVGENAARLIYNATSPPDPFDADSTEWLFITLANFLDAVGSRELEDRVWRCLLRSLPEEE